ncbi:hypothetical protein ACYOEI_14570, partial [Singulisphaera rosea]
MPVGRGDDLGRVFGRVKLPLAVVFGLLGLAVGAVGGDLAHPSTGRGLDLSRAVVLVPEGLSGPEEKA